MFAHTMKGINSKFSTHKAVKKSEPVAEIELSERADGCMSEIDKIRELTNKLKLNNLNHQNELARAECSMDTRVPLEKDLLKKKRLEQVDLPSIRLTPSSPELTPSSPELAPNSTLTLQTELVVDNLTDQTPDEVRFATLATIFEPRPIPRPIPRPRTPRVTNRRKPDDIRDDE